jgi:hypothetical protein
MSEPVDVQRVPRHDRLLASLGTCLGWPVDGLAVDRVTELSPGLSGARVFRVRLRGGPGAARRRSLILKVADPAARTGIASRDPGVATREARFYASGLAARLPAGLRAPRLLGVDRDGPRAWLWLEDVGPALGTIRTPAQILKAARRNAGLHGLYRAEHRALERLPWLEREGYAAHAHRVPAAHCHLDALPAHPRWGRLFESDKRAALHRALDRTPWAVAELRRLPLTLVHGDFHLGNLGFDAGGTLVAIDWAHVGLAPLGCDVATLSSLLAGAAGGAGPPPGSVAEGDLLGASCEALADFGDLGDVGDVGAVVRRACGLWHLTWGLHLRLGPGLDWLLRRPDSDSRAAAREARDIRDGARRALAFVAGA